MKSTCQQIFRVGLRVTLLAGCALTLTSCSTVGSLLRGILSIPFKIVNYIF